MKFEDITPEEIENYTTKLVPRLAQKEPGAWTHIDTIAKDVDRFIAICQFLVDDDYFRFPRHIGPIIDVWQDSLVRLSPDYLTDIHLKRNEN